jgi:hypothetical protein
MSSGGDGLDDLSDDDTLLDLQVKKVDVTIPAKRSEELVKALFGELSKDKVWRSSENLAKKLGIEKDFVESFLDSHNSIVRRLSKENDNTYMYAITSRAIPDNRKPAPKPDDYYVVSELRTVSHLLDKILKEHIHLINDRDESAVLDILRSNKSIGSAIRSLLLSINKK